MANCMTMKPCSGTCRSIVAWFQPKGLAAFSTRRPRAVVTKASLDPAAQLAVLQQGAAFAAVVGAEAAYTGLNMPANNKGRPELVPTLGGIGATVVAIILAQQQSPLDTVGCALGFAASGFFLVNYVLRTKDTEQRLDSEDWPGPKAWPAVMALIAFFSTAVFFQALRG